jgi:ribosomal protein L35
MARQKTNKTAVKRIKLSNPKGNRTKKLIYKQTRQGHLRTKRSQSSKRRQSNNRQVDSTNKKQLVRKIVNL